MNIQKKLGVIADEGCYLLCIWELGGRISGLYRDVVQMYDYCLSQGWIEEDCLVKEPGKILAWLTEGTWTYRKEYNLAYTPKPNERIIERWEWKKTGETKSHFVLPGWDPMGTSLTCTYGTKVSLRVLSRVS